MNRTSRPTCHVVFCSLIVAKYCDLLDAGNGFARGNNDRLCPWGWIEPFLGSLSVGELGGRLRDDQRRLLLSHLPSSPNDLKIHVRRKHAAYEHVMRLVIKPRSSKEGKPCPCPFPGCKCGYYRPRDLNRHLRKKHRVAQNDKRGRSSRGELSHK